MPNTNIDKSLDNLQKKSINLDLGDGRSVSYTHLRAHET